MGAAASASGVGTAVGGDQLKSSWFQDGLATLAEAEVLQPNRRRARNVILFVGDGMGVSTVTAAPPTLEGQLAGGDGEGNSLSFEELDTWRCRRPTRPITRCRIRPRR